jgi:hypothetical protein
VLQNTDTTERKEYKKEKLRNAGLDIQHMFCRQIKLSNIASCSTSKNEFVMNKQKKNISKFKEQKKRLKIKNDISLKSTFSRTKTHGPLQSDLI